MPREIPEDLKQFMATDPTVAALVEVYLRGDVTEAELWRQLAVFQTRAKLVAIEHASQVITRYGIAFGVYLDDRVHQDVGIGRPATSVKVKL